MQSSGGWEGGWKSLWCLVEVEADVGVIYNIETCLYRYRCWDQHRYTRVQLEGSILKSISIYVFLRDVDWLPWVEYLNNFLLIMLYVWHHYLGIQL